LSDNKYNNSDVKIGFPYGIGCGLAGGDWKKYKKMLEDFASQVKCQINVIKLE